MLVLLLNVVGLPSLKLLSGDLISRAASVVYVLVRVFIIVIAIATVMLSSIHPICHIILILTVSRTPVSTATHIGASHLLIALGSLVRSHSLLLKLLIMMNYLGL